MRGPRGKIRTRPCRAFCAAGQSHVGKWPAGPSVLQAGSRVGKWSLDRALIPPSLSPSNKSRMFLLWLRFICSLPPHPLPSAVFSDLTHWTPLLVSHYLEFPPNHSRCLPLGCTVNISLLSTVVLPSAVVISCCSNSPFLPCFGLSWP